MWPIFDLNQCLAFLHQIQIEHDDLDGETLRGARIELERFYLVHARTWLRTLEIIRRAFPVIDRPLRVLELGAMPYFFTALLAEHIPCTITGSTVPMMSWPGEALDVVARPVTIRRGAERPSLELTSWTFNIEKDVFPFPDGSFDLVLCMEVLEHLVYSPSHALAESHRVLAPGGHLVLTIPNYLRANRLVQLLLGRPDDYPYVGSGIQGRHQHEFTHAELRILLEACNYRVERMEMAMVWPWSITTTLPGRVFNAFVRGFLDLPLGYARNRRELIIALASPFGAPRLGYPPLLYDHPAAFPRDIRPAPEHV
jgi:SAM-dependent methyltransferase